MAFDILDTATYPDGALPGVVPRVPDSFATPDGTILLPLDGTGDEFDTVLTLRNDGEVIGEAVYDAELEFQPWGRVGVPLGTDTFLLNSFAQSEGVSGYLLVVDASSGTPVVEDLLRVPVVELADSNPRLLQIEDYIFPLSDGSVAYSITAYGPDGSGNDTVGIGVIQDIPNGPEVLFEQQINYDSEDISRSQVVPLPEGGYAMVFYSEGKEVQVYEYDSDGTLVNQDSIDLPTENARDGTGVNIDVSVTDEGDLIIYSTYSGGIDAVVLDTGTPADGSETGLPEALPFQQIAPFEETEGPLPVADSVGQFGVVAESRADGNGTILQLEAGTFFVSLSDGTVVTTPFEVVDGFAPRDGAEIGTPFTETPGVFLIPLQNPGTIEAPDQPVSVTVLRVTVDDTGAVTAVEAADPQIFADALGGTSEGLTSLNLFPLSDGRVGYEQSGIVVNATEQVGVISQGETGEVVVTPLVGGFPLDGATMALPDGGTVVVTDDVSVEYGTRLYQFDAEGNEIAEFPFDRDVLSAQGIDLSDDVSGVFSVDAEGELVLTIEDTSGSAPVYLTATYELLPTETGETPVGLGDLVLLEPFEEIDALPETADPDFTAADGSAVRVKVIFGDAPEEQIEIISTAPDGTETSTIQTLPAGASVAQNAMVFDAVTGSYLAAPIGLSGGAFAIPINGSETVGSGEDSFEVGDADLGVITVQPDGVSDLTIQELDLTEGTPGPDEGEFWRAFLLPLEDGRLQIKVQSELSGGVEPAIISAVLGPVENPLLLEPQFKLIEQLDRSSDGQDLFGYTYLPLDDGGAVAIGTGSIGLDDDDNPVVVTDVIQFDAAGNVLAEGSIRPDDDFSSSGAVASLTEDGELRIAVTDGDEVYQTVVDLVPLQDGPPPPPPPPPPPLPEATEGDDLLDLTAEADTMDGLAGDDTIFGRGGDDLILGGAGNDDIRGGAGNEGAGFGEAVAALIGGEGDDFIRGNAGDDELYGGAGQDDMNGGFGSDFVDGGAGDDKVSGYDGDDFLVGGSGNDALHGGRGADFLDGGEGDDTLRGAEGDDDLLGGEGDDLLIGGEGADLFIYSLPDSQGIDLIKDFKSGEDVIEIFGDDPLSFGDLSITQEGQIAVISIAETEIRLKGVEADELSEDDFVIY